MELRTLTKEELAEIIRKHNLWLNEEYGGEYASLNGANLNGANLNGANLNGANLNGASLIGASLDGASLDGAKLDGASLNGASLIGASLNGASLIGANLNGASLNGASLNGAKGKVLAIGPIGSRNGITYALWSDNDKSIHIQCGCFYGNFDEWVKKCAETHGGSVHGRAYAAAAEFIEAFAVINNWEGK